MHLYVIYRGFGTLPTPQYSNLATNRGRGWFSATQAATAQGQVVVFLPGPQSRLVPPIAYPPSMDLSLYPKGLWKASGC